MIVLEKLTPNDFEVFKSWIKDKDALFQFAGQFLKFPVTNEQLEKYITDEQRIVYKVVVSETNKMIGNAELNFENPLPRLSRVLIGDESYRNKGLGKQIINLMLEKLFVEFDFQNADLNVFDWNAAAIKCYEKAGFVVNPDVIYPQDNAGIIWIALNMIISKEKWKEKNSKNI